MAEGIFVFRKTRIIFSQLRIYQNKRNFGIIATRIMGLQNFHIYNIHCDFRGLLREFCHLG